MDFKTAIMTALDFNERSNKKVAELLRAGDENAWKQILVYVNKALRWKEKTELTYSGFKVHSNNASTLATNGSAVGSLELTLKRR